MKTIVHVSIPMTIIFDPDNPASSIEVPGWPKLSEQVRDIEHDGSSFAYAEPIARLAVRRLVGDGIFFNWSTTDGSNSVGGHSWSTKGTP